VETLKSVFASVNNEKITHLCVNIKWNFFNLWRFTSAIWLTLSDVSVGWIRSVVSDAQRQYSYVPTDPRQAVRPAIESQTRLTRAVTENPLEWQIVK